MLPDYKSSRADRSAPGSLQRHTRAHGQRQGQLSRSADGTGESPQCPAQRSHEYVQRRPGRHRPLHRIRRRNEVNNEALPPALQQRSPVYQRGQKETFSISSKNKRQKNSLFLPFKFVLLNFRK